MLILPWTPATDSPLRPLPGRPAHPYCAQQHEHQLRMVRRSTDRVEVPRVPDGYRLRQYGPADEQAYNDLFHLAFKDEGALARTLDRALDNGFFVIEHLASGRLVATCVAERGGWDSAPEIGILGWLAGDPSHLGKGLGTLAAAQVTNRLSEEGFGRPGLSTDDFRLAAIKIYLHQGWRPYLHLDDMRQRWTETFERLGKRLRPEDCVEP